MRFVIKSLLFVNLILLMTSSLRKCFDQDQNIMLTIIILAFSLIGLMGLIIGNRFILIIFSACMTLILIASITIYAINRSEPDTMQPKSPHFIHSPIDLTQALDSRRPKSTQNKLKTLVSKLINRNEKQLEPASKMKRIRGGQRLANGTNQDSTDLKWATSRSLSGRKSSPPIDSLAPLLRQVQSDDYSDEITIIPMPVPPLIAGRTGSSSSKISQSMNAVMSDQVVRENLPMKGSIEGSRLIAAKDGVIDSRQQQQQSAPDLEPQDDFDQVASEQWIMYEKYVYARYLNIVSQSIDLILHSILAAWMALLLDEDSDQCFGNKSTTKSRPTRIAKEPPVYNYNGVRYSIRPDPIDSPSRVVVR